MSFANFTTSKGNSAGLASGIPRKTNAFQVESHSKDSIDVTFQHPDSQFYKSGHVFKSSNAKGYTDNDGHLLSEEGPAYDKLAVYYPLDNLTNDQYADESGNNKHAKGYHIKPGMPGYKGCSTYFPGPFNSISFDGTDDFILIPEKFQTPNFTVAFWAYAVDDGDSGNTGWAASISNRYMDNSSNKYGWNFYTPGSQGSEGKWILSIGNGSNDWSNIETSSTVLYNVWHHVVGTYDGTTLKFYIDNQLIGTNTTTYGYSLSGNHFSGTVIGKNDHTSSFYSGQISDVRIYDTAITADQVSDIYNYGSILGHEVAHYKMEKTMGTNLVDSSGNEYDGTLNGGPTYAYGPYDASVSLPKEAFVFGEDDATVSVWMYAVSSDDKQIILSNNGYQQQFQFGIDKMSHETTYKKLFLKTKNTADNTTGYFLITETDFEPNRWYFLTIVRKDNNGYIYVDGIRCSTFNRSLTNMPKPMAHYKLDETSGSNANDSSGNGYNGTINGATVNQIGYNGLVSAYSFDGTDDYINFATFPSGIPSGNSSFTISVWINPTVHNGPDAIVGWGALSTNNSNVLRLKSTDKLLHYFYDDSFEFTTGSLVGKWTHIIITFDGNNRIMYINGVLKLSATFTTANVTATNFRIGCRPDNTELFNGQISDVRIYDKALTADQVNELYHERSSIYNFEEKTNLKLHLPLNHSLKDISGNGYNGSFFGGNPSYVENYKGDQNGALNFDSSNNYVSIADPSALSLNENLTLSVWFNSNVTSSWEDTLVSKGVFKEFDLMIYHNTGATSESRFRFHQGNSAGDGYVHYDSITQISNGIWYNLIVTREGSGTSWTIKFYLNGSLITTKTSPTGSSGGGTNTPAKTTNAIGISKRGDAAAAYFNGQMSDVRIYDRALTNIEVERLYQSTLRVDEYSPGTRINNGNIGSDNSPISIGKDLTERFHYSGYLQQLKIYNCALNPTQIAELYHNYTSNKYHAPLENDNMLMNNENLLPESKYLLAHYKFDGNGNDETGTYNATATNSPEYKKYGVFDQSAKINSKIVAVGWGGNGSGQLGIGNTSNVGDSVIHMGDNLKYTNVGTGKYPVYIASGVSFTSALLNDGSIKCWGKNDNGQLGYGNTTDIGIGSNEMGDNLPTVNLGTGRTAVQISNGSSHTGVILDNGSVKCWGSNDKGQLGYGDTTERGSGDSQMGDNLPTVDLGTGRTAVQISLGFYHTCVLLDDGTVKCWGKNDNGQLGYGDRTDRGIGSNEMGDNLPTVDLGTGRTAIQISSGYEYTCAILDDGTLKCWGYNIGNLGYGDTTERGSGSNEMGDNLPIVDLGTGRTAIQVVTGFLHTCALLDDKTVKCWGINGNGQLGFYNNLTTILEPNSTPVDLGTNKTCIKLSAGYYITRALLNDGTIKCWGYNGDGSLGYGDTDNRATLAGQMGDNLPTVDLGNNLIKCLDISTSGYNLFIIGQYKGVGATDLTIANQQDYTISHEISNINSFSGWIKTDNISSGNLPIIYFNSNNYLYVDSSNNSLYFFSSDSAAGSQKNLYVNGNLVATSNTGGDITNSANSITASFNKNNKKITIDSQLQPVAHYKLDEGTGTTAFDSSGNGYNGTLTGGPVYTSNQNSIYGKALSFDGTNDYVTTGNINTGSGGFGVTNKITVTCWAKSDTENWNAHGMLISKRDSFIMSPIETNKEMRFYVYTSDWAYIDYTPSSITEWAFYTGTYDGTELKLYINGSLVASGWNGAGSQGSNINNDTGQLYVGHDDGLSGRYFNGKMSDVRIYNQALTATQVKQLYNNSLLSTNVTLNKDQLLYISDAVDSNNNGFKNITYSQNNKASNYETEINTNEYIDDESNDKISVQLGRIEPEKWYHVVLTTTSAITTSNPFYFGKQSTNYFSGCIDDFRLYKKVLTHDEVKHLYNRQLSGNNLALHLPLSEPNNTSLDDKSIYKHVTTNHGVESGDIGPVGGSIKFNPFGVISFDGINDMIDLSAHSNLFTFAGGFTFSTWVLFKTINTASIQTPNGFNPRLFYLSNSSMNDLTFNGGALGSNDSDLVFSILRGSEGTPHYSVNTTTNPLVTNTWMHITLTVNNSSKNVIIYKNGVSILDTTIGASYVEEARDYSFINAAPLSLHGDMADVRFYNSILTAEQVKDIYFNQTILGTEALHYKFNEKMGTTAFDSSGNGYDGTLTGGPTYYLSNPYRNYAMNFDNTNNNYIEIPNPSADLSKNLTLSMWIYRNDQNESRGDTLISKSYAREFELIFGQYLRFINGTTDRGGNNYYYDGPATNTISAKEWHHILVTREGSNTSWTVKFYINSVFNTSSTGSTGHTGNNTPQIDTYPIFIGIRNSNGTPNTGNDFSGKMSDVRVYDYALDSEEIYKVYKTGEVFGNEILHITFNQAAGDRVLDQSSNRHHGTAINGPTYQKIENPTLGSYLTVDSAERFNHSNGYLYPMYDISSKSHSFFCWMKLDENYTSGKNDNCIFSKVLNKNYVDMALSLNNGKLEFETKFNDNIDSSIIELYPTFLPNQWYHIGYSINYETSIKNEKNGILKFYINGIMHTKYVAGDKSYTTSKNNSITTHNMQEFHNSKLYIGKRGDSSLSTFNDSTFRGSLSDIRFYEAEITPIQARELFFNRNDGEIINTTHTNVSENKLLEKTYDGTDILIGHWKLGVGISKVVLDNSKDPTYKNNHGFLIGFDSKRVEGITGSVPVFDGTDAHVQITPSASISTIKSIAFWIKPAAVTQKTLIYITSSIYIKIDGSSKVNAFGFTSPSIYLNGKTESVTTSSNDNYGNTALVANKWYHITITSSTAVTTESAFYFGKRSNAYYSGLIDDVRFYDVVLTASQANNLYGQNSTVNVPYNSSLVGKWLLNGDFKDSSGYNNDGVLSGDAKFITGYDGNLAFKSNANNSTISVLNTYTTLRSISFWVYLEKLNQTILTTASGLYIKIESTGKINSNGITSPSIYINGVKNTISTTTGDYEVPLNKWVHITITKSAVITGNTIVFGDNSFKGAIQNVEFYDTQLTDAQVKDIYKYGTYNNLVLHYKFDEGSGIVAKDSSKNNYHGIINGGATYTSDHLGISNRALNFDGVDDYVTTGNINTGSGGLEITNQITVSCWVKSDTENWNHTQVLIRKNNSFILSPQASSKLVRFYIYDSEWEEVSYTMSTINTWNLYTGTYDGSNINLYVNGSLVDTFAHSGTINNNSNSIIIGYYFSYYGRYFDGQISDVRIYNYALNADQVTDLYYENKSHHIENLGYDHKYLTLAQKDTINNSINAEQVDIKRDNLEVYLKFQDSGSTVVNDYNYSLKPGLISYSIKNGTFSSTISDTDLVHSKDGINDKALAFNGTSHSITFSNTITFSLGVGGTISLWIKPENINRDILQLTSAIYLQLTNDFKLKLVFDNSTTDIYLYNNGIVDSYVSSGTELKSNTSLSPQIWTHIGLSFLTYNSTNLSANAIKLGLNANSNYFDGEMDELKIYSIQLTHHDMYQLYLDRKTSPIVHLPMNESSGHTLCNIGSSKIDIRKVPSFKKTEDQIIAPTDMTNSFRFGKKTCASENFLIISDDDEDSFKGVVYIFTYNGTSWTQSQKIVSPVVANNVKFGNSIDIFNNTLAITANLDSAGTGQGNFGGVYIYNYDGSSWSQSQLVRASDKASGDFFGYNISIFNNTIAISSVGRTNVNIGVGKVYIFENNGSIWSESFSIDSPDTTKNNNFGEYIKLYDNTLFIGTNENNKAGSVYIYQKISNSSWINTQKLVSPTSSDFYNFGSSIEIGEKNTLFIGEYNSVNGKVYVYNYSSSSNTWTLSQTITNGSSGDRFGFSLSYYDSILHIGSTGFTSFQGKLYLYKYISSNDIDAKYEEIQQLEASNGATRDDFSFSIAASKHGIISTAFDSNTSDKGSVYFYKRNDTINQTSTDIQPVFNKNCLKFVGTDAGTKDFYEIPFVVKNIKSVSFWINPEAVGERILFQIDRTNSKNIKIDSSDNITTTGFTSPTIFINGTKEGGSPTTITTHEWYHICVITSTGLNSINGQTFIGYDIPANSGTTSTKYFKGQMSDFRIYDCTLTNSEIQKIYQSSNIYKSIY